MNERDVSLTQKSMYINPYIIQYMYTYIIQYNVQALSLIKTQRKYQILILVFSVAVLHIIKYKLLWHDRILPYWD